MGTVCEYDVVLGKAFLGDGSRGNDDCWTVSESEVNNRAVVVGKSFEKTVLWTLLEKVEMTYNWKG